MNTCPYCHAALGPYENVAGCLTCRKIRPRTAAERTLAALETAPSPLAYWDIQRLTALQSSRPLADATLQQTLGWRQFCWAGRGLYGLYRHGLLPGVRDLASVAGVLIHASDRQLEMEELQFVMRHVGYRFVPSSLVAAMHRISGTGLFTDFCSERFDGSTAWMFSGSRSNIRHERAAAKTMHFHQRGPVVTATLDRAAERVAEAMRARARRLPGHEQ
jgi:hypothetical protein